MEGSTWHHQEGSCTYFVTNSVLNHRVTSIISVLSFLQTAIQYLLSKCRYKVESVLSSTTAHSNKTSVSLTQ